MKITHTRSLSNCRQAIVYLLLWISFPDFLAAQNDSRLPGADLGNGTFLNPVLKGDFGDPTVVRDGKDYYMTHHSPNAPSQLLWHSQDLVNWEPMGFALPQDLGFIWAADLIKYKDKFYMYLPVPDRNTNYVITADHPAGPWSQPIDLKVSGIDPGHMVTPDGKRFLHLDNGYIVSLSDNGTEVTSEKKKVYDGWQYPKEWITECFCLESPKVTYRNGYYYLTVAQGGTAGPPTSHMVVSARSRSPLGPWENSPYNPIIRNANRNAKWASPGHGTLVDDIDGNWWMMLHGYEQAARTLGRHSLLVPVAWTADGWFKVPDSVDLAKPLRKPPGRKVQGHMELSENFAGGKLGVQWKVDAATGRRITVANNQLNMKGTGDSPGNSPSIFFYPMNESFEVSVAVNPSDSSAGGLIFLDNEHFTGLEVSNGFVWQINQEGRKQKLAACAPASTRIKLKYDYEDVIFYYSVNGKSWEKADLSVNISTWDVMKVGLFATGTGHVSYRSLVYKAL
ncbi:MAG: beta-xylosidase [Chitinophagaceae bacterium]|nr:MAG: beta-xylosidase [Chitinophagaceae bacterium]